LKRPEAVIRAKKKKTRLELNVQIIMPRCEKLFQPPRLIVHFIGAKEKCRRM